MILGVGLGTHRIHGMSSGEGKGLRSGRLTATSRMQDTGYKLQNAVYKPAGYKDAKDAGYKMHRIQDTGYSKSFAAWWPPQGGPADLLFLFMGGLLITRWG